MIISIKFLTGSPFVLWPVCPLVLAPILNNFPVLLRIWHISESMDKTWSK